MHFRHISAKLQPKHLKNHFDWGGADPWAHPLATPLPASILGTYPIQCAADRT